MCPQSRCNDKGNLYREALQLIDMIKIPPETITLTGGEPTFFKDKFLEIIRHLREKWPQTKLVVLTNARTFSNLSFAKQVVTLSQGNIEFGIPLYSDSAIVHDEIVGMERSWSQTIAGLYNLASLKCCIELRVVVMKTNYKRLAKLISFVAHNLPFVHRIVFMGIEPMGKAREIWDNVWVDPLDAAEEIASALQVAKHHSLNIYLYNHQLCCLPRHLRKYAVSSISDWKRIYIDACNGCPMRHDCGGFFESQNATPYYSRLFNTH
jgi:His-Xaa-Ser system radical SAM maturase HxsC